MQHQFRMARIYNEHSNLAKSDEATEKAVLMGEFIKTLETLKWDYT